MTDTLEAIARVAAVHRALVGARPGVTMTDEQCRHHAALVADELERRGIEPGAREWFTAQRATDGGICGRWAHSRVEAALMLSFHGELAWLVVDDRLAVYDEYYPHGRRAGDREAFPVTPAPVTRAELVMLETPAGALF